MYRDGAIGEKSAPMLLLGRTMGPLGSAGRRGPSMDKVDMGTHTTLGKTPKTSCDCITMVPLNETSFEPSL